MRMQFLRKPHRVGFDYSGTCITIAVCCLLIPILSASQLASVITSEKETVRIRGIVDLASNQAGQIFLFPFQSRTRSTSQKVWSAATAPDGSFEIDLADFKVPVILLAVTEQFLSLRGPYLPSTISDTPLIRFDSTFSTILRGRILNSEGFPVRDAVFTPTKLSFTNLPDAVQQHLQTRSEADGTFSLRLVEGIPARLQIRHPGYPTLGLEVTRPEHLQITLPQVRVLSGKILSIQGKPIPDGEVFVYASSEERSSWRSKTVSNSNGEFVLPMFDSLDWAQVRVYFAVQARGYVPFTQHTHFHELVSTEFRLEPANSIQGSIIWPRDTTGASKLALLRLLRKDPHSEGASDAGEVISKQQVTNGSFSFSGLSAGTYTLEIWDRQYGLLRRGPFEVRGEGVKIDLGTFPVERGEIDILGDVADEVTGSPLGDVRVRLLEKSVYFPVEPEWLPEVRTSRGGSFQMRGIRSGDFELEFYREGYEWKSVGAGEAGYPQKHLNILLKPGGGSIEGQLSKGRNALEKLVCLMFSKSSDSFLYTTPDSEGRFRFNNLPIGQYHVINLSPGSNLRPERLSLGVSQVGQRVRVRFHEYDRPLRVAGTATAGNEPLKGARIKLYSSHEEVVPVKWEDQALVDRSGRFEAQVHSPGVYDVHIAFPTSFFLAGQIQVDGRGPGVRINLPHTKIRGRVFDERTVRGLEGLQFGGFRVPAGPYQERPTEFKGRTGPSGEFEVIGVVPGVYHLHFKGDEHLAHELEVSVTEGQTQNVQVALKRGRSFRGRLLNRDGLPLSGTRIYGIGSLGLNRSAVTDTAGHFELRGLDFSAYALLVRAQGEGLIAELGETDNGAQQIDLQTTLLGSVIIANVTPQSPLEIVAENGVVVTGFLSDSVEQIPGTGLKIGQIPKGRYLVRMGSPGAMKELNIAVEPGSAVKTRF